MRLVRFYHILLDLSLISLMSAL